MVRITPFFQKIHHHNYNMSSLLVWISRVMLKLNCLESSNYSIIHLEVFIDFFQPTYNYVRGWKWSNKDYLISSDRKYNAVMILFQAFSN